MTSDLIIFGVIEPVATVLAGGFFWWAVERRIKRRDDLATAVRTKREQEEENKKKQLDAQILGLQTELKDLRDEKFKALTDSISSQIGDIKDRLVRETEGRKNIHQRLDEDFARQQHVTAVEQQVSNLSEKLDSVKDTATETKATVDLIARHLRINFKGSNS